MSFDQNNSGSPVFIDNGGATAVASYFNDETNTVVRVLSTKKRKKEYKITNIEDVSAKNNWKAWIYLAPVLVLLVIFLIYPLINTIAIAFMNNFDYQTGTFDGFTFDNFAIIFGQKEIITEAGQVATETAFTDYAIQNTFFLVFVTVPLTIIIALLISIGLNSIKWFQKALQTIFFLPYVTNTIAVGMVFSVIFDNTGIINNILGIDTVWIYGAERWTAMVPLVIYIVWSGLPFKILIFLSGLQGIDKQYYDAAKIDSAPRRKVLWHVTIPLLSPQILYIVITSFIGAFKEYSSIVGLFNGPSTSGKQSNEKNMYTIVYYIYENLNTFTSRAAAAAVFLFAIILIFTVLQLQVSKKRVHY